MGKGTQFFGGIESGPKRLAQALRDRGHTVDLNGKADHYDIHHIHFGFPIRKLKRLKKSSTVIAHGHSVPQDMYGGIFGFKWVAWIATWYIRRYYNQAPIILPVSRYAEDCIREIGVTTPTHVLSNGINLTQFVPGDRKKAKIAFCKRYNLDPSKPVIGGIGSMFPRKGILDFLQTAKELPEVQFVWVGKYLPTYPKWIMQWRIRKRPQNAQFIGFVEDIMEFYHALDLLIIPTLVETQGIPVLEGAATKTPILARNIPAFDWLDDGKNCRLAENQSEFTEIIHSTLDQGYDEKLIEQAYIDVQDHDIKKVAAELEEIYREQLNS